MTWIEIGKNHLQAAKRTLDEQPRSAVSRAYYAAHVVLADALAQAGCPLAAGRQTPGHASQAKLIGTYLSPRGQVVIKEAPATIRRLYSRRIDADYKRTVTIDRDTARASIRDASALFLLLNVR